MPCAGTVEDISYQPGQFLVANKPDATLRNEQNAVMLRAESGAKVLCVQVAGLIARRIVCWVGQGESVERGDRFGLIRFGSRMDTFLPLGSTIRVAVGDRVKGGEDHACGQGAYSEKSPDMRAPFTKRGHRKRQAMYLIPNL